MTAFAGLESLAVLAEVQHLIDESPPLADEVFEWYAGKYRHELDRWVRSHRRRRRAERGIGRRVAAGKRRRHGAPALRLTSARAWARPHQRWAPTRRSSKH